MPVNKRGKRSDAAQERRRARGADRRRERTFADQEREIEEIRRQLNDLTNGAASSSTAGASGASAGTEQRAERSVTGDAGADAAAAEPDGRGIWQ